MTTLSTQGFSAEARYISRASTDGRRRLLESTVIGTESVRDELGEVWEECRNENWDSYGAKGVSSDALRNAYCFLEALPLGCPAPSISGEPDGALTFEWHRDHRHTLSVSIDGDENLYFAALLGPMKSHGSDIFFGDIPEMILDLIGRVSIA